VVVIENGDEQLAKDIAMHVAASQPDYIQISDIPEDVIDEERKILTKQVEDEGKPAEIIPKIVDGKAVAVEGVLHRFTYILDDT